MNHELQHLAVRHSVEDERLRMLRPRFGVACANRVRHRLEEPRAVELLDVLQAFVDGRADDSALQAAAGKALDAAEYAAYSAVYGYGGYAVNDPDSFTLEYSWQVNALEALLHSEAVMSAH